MKIKARDFQKIYSAGMNKAEIAYSRVLFAKKHEGYIIDYRFEALKLKLATLTFYTPDFMVIMPDHTIEMHDVKALWKGETSPHVEDDAAVKIKVAAAEFPEFLFRLVWLSPAGWQDKEIPCA